MSTLTMAAFAPGTTHVVHWEGNLRSTAPNAVKSNKTDAGKSKKIILPVANSGVQPRPGEVWMCRVSKVTSKSETHGAIHVQPLTRKLEYQFKDVWVEPVTAQIIVTILQDPRRNLMMEGEQGVGKSTIAWAISNTLGWEFREVNGGLIKKFYAMVGRHAPKIVDEKLLFEWIDSGLVAALREAGANPRKIFLVMIDEYSRMDEDARDALLNIIEGKRRFIRLPTGEEVPVPENVKFMAAANVGDAFTLKKQDAAAKSRWVVVKIRHMPQEHELAHCLRIYPQCPKAQMDKALTIINVLREARKDPSTRLSKIPCTRGAESVASLLSGGHALDVVLETAVVNQFDGSKDNAASEAGIVYNLIQNELKKSA